MKSYKIIILALLGAFSASGAQVNLWRGDETGSNWTDEYKWKLKHAPQGSEPVHFRQQNSVIAVNSTVELGNGMHLYGQELLLEGNGNINLRSPIPHQRTINIPASSSGYANLTITDNLSVNATVALAAKAFGTSAGKGSLTLKDRTNITGEIAIGNRGSGTGQIILRDQASYRVTRLVLDTEAAKGGSAEIQILGGTVRMDTDGNPFEQILADPSRKIIIGGYGVLHIESDLPTAQKRELLERMIAQKQLVSGQGCKLDEPVIRDNMVTIKAKYNDTQPVLAGAAATKAPTVPTKPAKTERLAKGRPSGTPATPEPESTPSAPLSGYIVFLGGLALLLVRPTEPGTRKTPSRSAVPKQAPRDEKHSEKTIPFPKKAA